MYYETYSISCNVIELFSYISIINEFINRYGNESLNYNLLFSQKISDNNNSKKDYRALSFFGQLTFADFVQYLYDSKVYYHSYCNYVKSLEQECEQTYETVHFKTQNKGFYKYLTSLYNGRTEENENGFLFVKMGNLKTDGAWFSYLNDINNPGKEIFQSQYKKALIKEIINKSWKSFPSEMDFICDFLKK